MLMGLRGTLIAAGLECCRAQLRTIGKPWQAVIHPDDAPVSKERWQEALETGEVFIEVENTGCVTQQENIAGSSGNCTGPRQQSHHRVGRIRNGCPRFETSRVGAAGKRRALSIDGRWRARLRHLYAEPQQRDRLLERQRQERVFGWSAAEAVGESGEIVFTPEDRENEQEKRKSRRRCEKAAQAIGAGTSARTARESGWTA